MNAFPWTIFAIFVLAGLLGTAAVMPYSLSANAKILKKVKEKEKSNPEGEGLPAKKTPNLPFPVLIVIGLIQSTLLIGLAAFLGLLAGRQVGLGAPILQAALQGQPVMDRILAMLPAAVLLGFGSGALIMVLEAFYFMPRIPRQIANLDVRTPFWKRLLACFYGGMDEEILMRLFLMTGLVWLLGLIWRTPTGAPAVAVLWTANLLSALLFGAGHLPATAMNGKLTPIVVTRALLLNGIVGLAFGYLYMRYGLEAAMLAHFSADIAIHLVATPFIQRLAEALPPEPAAQAA